MKISSLSNAELMKQYDFLRGFIKGAKENIAKDGKWLGYDLSNKAEFKKVTEILEEREEHIASYRKEILERMRNEG